MLFMWVFRRLEKPSLPSFQQCMSVLDTVCQVNLPRAHLESSLFPSFELGPSCINTRNAAQVKCCLLMLDFDTDDLVCDLFKVLFDTIRQALYLLRVVLSRFPRNFTDILFVPDNAAKTMRVPLKNQSWRCDSVKRCPVSFTPRISTLLTCIWEVLLYLAT